MGVNIAAPDRNDDLKVKESKEGTTESAMVGEGLKCGSKIGFASNINPIPNLVVGSKIIYYLNYYHRQLHQDQHPSKANKIVAQLGTPMQPSPRHRQTHILLNSLLHP